MIVLLALTLQLNSAATAMAAKPHPAKPPATSQAKKPVVIVDAGHGGPDNGMSGPLTGKGPKIYEKNITLAVSKRLGAALVRRGVDVVYTRTTDTLIDLSDRGAIANKSGGAVFISIHVNAAHPSWRDPAATRGFETYFLSDAKTDDAQRVEDMENESVKFEAVKDLPKEDPLSFILSDMKQNEHLRESNELAEAIQHSLSLVHPSPNRGVRQAGFRVLVTAFMPSVLVEIGFGTNPTDAAFITDPRHQDAIANAIADATMTYLAGYELRVKGSSQ
jgi:N-acetylmuramoyl-L-alanine amidase